MTKNFNLPIFTQIYELYKEIYSLRSIVPKQDRYALWQKIENTVLEILEDIYRAISQSQDKKIKTLNSVSQNLNLLRILIRLSKDIKAIDSKKYINLEARIDEIGRMLGGWIKSTKIPQKKLVRISERRQRPHSS